jgi:hypothetical protein
MDLGLKLCTMIIYIYNYVLTALGRKLWTCQQGGGGGSERVVGVVHSECLCCSPFLIANTLHMLVQR